MKHTIANFYSYNALMASGAQPAEHDLIALAEEGFEAIVNISTGSAKNALQNEAALVEKTGMYYVHFPVDCGNLQPLHYKTFKGIMNGLKNKKVFVHCGANIKSSNLLHMYHVLENKLDEASSLQTLRKIQDPEEKWFAYFKQMGMNGVK